APRAARASYRRRTAPAPTRRARHRGTGSAPRRRSRSRRRREPAGRAPGTRPPRARRAPRATAGTPRGSGRSARAAARARSPRDPRCDRRRGARRPSSIASACRPSRRGPRPARLGRVLPVARKLLWASLALAPATILVDLLAHPGKVALFVLAAVALVPLAWLIGESTEHAAEHTGPGIGGFLNASFGNAPELIIALFAIADGLPNVVRGSLTGSVVSNLLLVLGVAIIAGGDVVRLDRHSLLLQLGLVAAAVLLFLIPSVPGFHGNAERHDLVVLSIPVA